MIIFNFKYIVFLKMVPTAFFFDGSTKPANE